MKAATLVRKHIAIDYSNGLPAQVGYRAHYDTGEPYLYGVSMYELTLVETEDGTLVNTRVNGILHNDRQAAAYIMRDDGSIKINSKGFWLIDCPEELIESQWKECRDITRFNPFDDMLEEILADHYNS